MKQTAKDEAVTAMTEIASRRGWRMASVSLVLVGALSAGLAVSQAVPEPGTGPNDDSLTSRSDAFKAAADKVDPGEAADNQDITAPDREPAQRAPRAELSAKLPQGGGATVTLTQPNGTNDDASHSPMSTPSPAPSDGSSQEPDTSLDPGGAAQSGSATIGGVPITIASPRPLGQPSRVRVQVSTVQNHDPTDGGTDEGEHGTNSAQEESVDEILLDIENLSVPVPSDEDESDSGPDPDGDDGLVEVELGVSYEEFAGLVGGDWASRLQLVRIPACADERPDDPECQRELVESSVNDVANQMVTATVELPAATSSEASGSGGVQPAGFGTGGAQTALFQPLGGIGVQTAAQSSGSNSSTYALTAGTSGPSGDWTATNLAPVSSWATSGGTGAFTWSYPFKVPAVPSGNGPQLQLSYSSASADGRVSSTNNQSPWVGEGFDLTSSYIERKYVPCADDQKKKDGKEPNNSEKNQVTGDQCWHSDNATMLLSGSSSDLFKDDGGVWRSENADGSLIELNTDGWSGTEHPEYWVVTTTDGTKYYFGRDKAFKDGPSLNSAWTVPVFGNHPGEPCYKTKFAESQCDLIWRWNLDYVVDPLGNTMTYTYEKHENWYRLFKRGESIKNKGTLAKYNPGGYLKSIGYGNQVSDDKDERQAPARVLFQTQPRCDTSKASSCDFTKIRSNKKHWPDVPGDLVCRKDQDKPCETFSPVFFDVTRLNAVVTQARDTGGVYRPVDTWTFKHGYDSTDGVTQVLWLDELVHTGNAGTATAADDLSERAIKFSPEWMKNRVGVPLGRKTPGGSAAFSGPSMFWPRLVSVQNEAGAETSVSYSAPDCKPNDFPAKVESNVRLCFPVVWDGPLKLDKDKDDDKDDIPDWFNKYVVNKITESPSAPVKEGEEQLVTGSVPVETAYDYKGAPKWIKTKGLLIKPKDATYADFLGYPRVLTTVGSGAEQSTTLTEYFRGTGDTLRAGPLKNGVPEISAHDHERVRGQVFASTQLLGSTVNATPVSQTVTVPSDLTTVAQGPDGKKSTLVKKTAVHGYTYSRVGAVDIHTQVTTTTNNAGQIIEVNDAGDVTRTGDDNCTVTTYATEASDMLLYSTEREKYRAKNMLSLPLRVQVFGTACSTKNNLISDTLTFFTPEGLPKQTWGLDHTLNYPDSRLQIGSRFGYMRTSVANYDQFGRLVSTTDVLGRETKTVYRDTAQGLNRETEVISPITSLKSTTTINPVTGTVTSTTDANNQSTSATYDALGRLRTVRFPEHAGLSIPSTQYEYVTKSNGLNAVTTKTVAADGKSQHTSVTFYDGLMRVFQEQSESKNAGFEGTDNASTRGRIVSHTYYDSAGRVNMVSRPWHVKGAPRAGSIAAATGTEPSTTYLYDRAGRVTDEILWKATQGSLNNEISRTVTVYDGAYTMVIPPAGGTTVTTMTDAAGRVVDRREYTNPIAPTAPVLGQSSSYGLAPRSVPYYQRTAYTFDAAGRMTQMKNPAQDVWSYAYDRAGNQISATDPDSGTTTSTYDKAGQLLSVTNAQSQTTMYQYDAVGRKTAVFENGGMVASWVYDAVKRGQLASTTTYLPGGQYKTQVEAYDAAYRPVSTTVTVPAIGDLARLSQRSFTTSYKYTADGQVAEMTLPGVEVSGNNAVMGAETVRTQYDAASQPRWMSGGFGWGTYVADSAYRPVGQLQVLDLGTTYGAFVSYDYDEYTDRLTQLTLAREQIAGLDINLRYRYDKAGNVTQISDTPSTSTSQFDNQCFAYDPLRRLTRAWTPQGAIVREDNVTSDVSRCDTGPGSNNALITGAAPYSEQYTYDNRGNMLTRVSYGLVQASTKSTTTLRYGVGAAGPHALTSVTTTPVDGSGSTSTFNYDAAGQQASRNVVGKPYLSLTWNSQGKLTKTTGTGVSDEHFYDGEGSRIIRRSASGTTVFLPGGQEVTVASAARAGRVSVRRFYQFAGQTVAVRSGGGLGGVTSLVADHHGTVLAGVPNTTWTVGAVRRVFTDPWGAPRGQTVGAVDSGALAQSVGERLFLGKTRDASTGLTMLGARFYDEAVGRFISVDPLLDPGVPAQFNAYVYSGNNPLTWSDPTGLSWSAIGNGIVGFGKGVYDIGQGLASISNPVSWWNSAQSTRRLASENGGGLGGWTTALTMNYNPVYSVLDSGANTIDSAKAGDWQNAARSGTGLLGDAALSAVPGGAAAKGLTGAMKPRITPKPTAKPTPAPPSTAAKTAPDGLWFPKRALPRTRDGVPVPESPYPHTQLGWKSGRNGDYPQAREFGADGKPIKDIDFTDHGRSATHPNPHQHPWVPNETGGTPRRGPSEPWE